MQRLIAQHWGKPPVKEGDGKKASGVLIAARVSSYELRGIPDDGSLREDTDDDDTYRREILAIPMPKGSMGFFPAVALAKSLDAKPPDTAPDESGAGGDFAFERDCAATGTVGRWRDIFAVTMVEERRATPGDEVAQTTTVRELGAGIAAMGLRTVMADDWRKHFVREHLAAEGVSVIDAPSGPDGKARMYGALKRVIGDGKFCLGLLDRKTAEYVLEQLRSVVSIALPGGTFRITAPRSRRMLDGTAPAGSRLRSHADVVSAIVNAAWVCGSSRTAASWQIPHAPGHARSSAASPARRGGAGGSMAYLREHSVFGGRSPRRDDG